MECRGCGRAQGLRLSRSRSWLERVVLRRLGWRAIRCLECDLRFMSFSTPPRQRAIGKKGTRTEFESGEVLRRITEQLSQAEQDLSPLE